MITILSYPVLIIASLFVILVFITAKSYSQLAMAVVIYSALVFLVLKIFPRKSTRSPKNTTQTKLNLATPVASRPDLDNEPGQVTDINRRTFIKLICATGISFLLFSLLGKRVESLLFGGSALPGANPTRSDGSLSQTDVSPTDGYKITEIDEGLVNYYGFVNITGAWTIMKEDTNESSFRYAKGNSDFPRNWKDRENLRYDYFYNLF